MEWGGIPTKEFLENANNYKYLYKISEDPFFAYYSSNEEIKETNTWIVCKKSKDMYYTDMLTYMTLPECERKKEIRRKWNVLRKLS
jgi:hypothetical protein